MAPKKLKCYTAAFKLAVIDKAESIGNRAAGREFGVDERCVRRWRSEKSVLEKMPKAKKARRSGVVAWPNLESNLAKWVREQRINSIPVSTVQIRLQARILATNMGINNFKGGPNWCFRFMARNGLSMRSRTTVGQALPSDWEEKKSSFLNYVTDIIREKKFSMAQVVNMDEVPLTFDCPPSRTVNTTGEKSINIITTGNEKTSFTCVLACAANGDKLKPLIIFRRKTMPKGNFPPDVVIRCNEKGWMSEEIMLEWLAEVWKKRKNSFFQPSGLLIMDSMRAHLVDSVKAAARKNAATLAIIPGGLTKILQPLDLAVNKSFKSKIRKLWETWMVEGLHSYTKSGKMRKATYEDVASWVSLAWKDVSSKTVMSGFKAANISETGTSNDSSDESNDESCELLTDKELLELFNSDSENSDFDGFDDI